MNGGKSFKTLYVTMFVSINIKRFGFCGTCLWDVIAAPCSGLSARTRPYRLSIVEEARRALRREERQKRKRAPEEAEAEVQKGAAMEAEGQFGVIYTDPSQAFVHGVVQDGK